MTSDDMSSSTSGKQRTSSSTFYDELDAIPSSPTVFGVKLKSRRHSQKSCESVTDKVTTPSSPVSPISPRTYADNRNSNFSYSFIGKKKTEKNEEEKTIYNTSDPGYNGLKSINQDKIADESVTGLNTVSDKEISDGLRSGSSNNTNNNKVEAVRLADNKKADVVQVPDSAEQKVEKENKETSNEATDIIENKAKPDATCDVVDNANAASRKSMTELNKILSVKNEKDTASQDEDNIRVNITCAVNNGENNAEAVENNIVSPLHSDEFKNDIEAVNNNLSDENCIARYNNEFDKTVAVEESLKLSSKQNKDESDTSGATDTNSGIVDRENQCTENVVDKNITIDSENLKDDISSVQMRRGGASDIHAKVADQYSDVDLSQVEMRKSSRSRSRGSYRTDSEQVTEARNTEVSASLERLRALKGSLSLQDNEDNVVVSDNHIDITMNKAEYVLYDKKDSRKLENLSSLCINGDLDEPVFAEVASSVKPKRTQLNLDAYTKLKTFITEVDKNYDVEYHRKSTEFPVAVLKEMLLDI